MQKIEHIGIAVRNLEDSIALYTRLLNTPCYKIEEVMEEKVRTAFFQTGESKVELLESLEPDSVISKFIEKKGEGLHHIAFAVEDIQTEMKKYREMGFTLTSEEPKKGADNKLICFIHPKETGSVLIELCQEIT